jgi:hypothetical protein
MHPSWKLVFIAYLLALCGQTLGFWLFDVLAAKDGPDNLYETSGPKRVAIIGMQSFLWIYLGCYFFLMNVDSVLD